MGMDRFRPWRKHLPAAAVEHTLPSVQRHIVSVQVAPEAVREARQAVAEHLPKVGIAADARGEGLRTVAELADIYDGDVSVEPAVDHDGKVVLVRFRIPYPQTPGDARR
ncbi:hypothetical protein OG729_36260 [Streptomyces sp. NBC_00210]|uniref:hypothetical protein n=1 Tax=unclassified Streptomyces TaxID=2593676 RepID=UPI00324AB46F